MSHKSPYRSDAPGAPLPPDIDPLAVLAQAALGREPLAVRRFLEAITPKVRAVCLGVLGKDDPDLEDHLQESLVELLRALPKYRGDGPLVFYANRIALRVCLASRRRQRRRAHRLAEVAQHQASETPAIAPDFFLLRIMADALPRKQAEALYLRVVLGYSLEEMAEILDIPLNTAKSRVRVAKDVLRERAKIVGLIKRGHA